MGAYDPTAWGVEFLSTLSLRRATGFGLARMVARTNFYPRSPCGERQHTYTYMSILFQFLSTLSLRRATTPEEA